MVAQVVDRRDAPALVVIDGGKMRLNLHRGQQRAWRSTKRFVCVIAGSQSGKTAFGPHWLRREISLRGPGDYMVVTPTFPLLEIKALPEFRRLFEDQLQLGTYHASPPRRFEVSPEGEIRLFGKRQDVPTTVWFGYASDPDSLESATAKGVWADEAGQTKFKLGSWDALNRRVSLHQGRVLVTSTPYNLGWLYQVIWQPWMSAGRDHPYIDVINFESTMNPAFSEEEFERLRESMPAWKFDLFHRGIFTRPAGLIYDNWDDAWVIPPFPIPEHWPRYAGVDFGGVNTAGLFTAVELDERNQPTGILIHYREYLAGSMSASEHATVMTRGEPRKADGSTALVAIGGAPSEDQWRREFTRGGLPIHRPPVKDVEVGIDRVYEAQAKGQIRVFNTLSRYLEQKRTYTRVLDETGEPTEKIEDKETFHLLDCERYEISHLRRPPGRKPGVR
jgi:hypothetical protein